jgi:DNA ligase (NAD+)
MGIKGMGTKTIEKLELADITELYYLDVDQLAEQLGSQKVAEKLIVELDRSRSAPLNQVLASMSIPLVGNTASQKICQVVNHISEINLETCKQAGLGDKVTQNLLAWLETDFPEMKEFLPFSFRSETQVVNTDGKSVCITGKLSSYKTKAEAYKHLIDCGFKITESVTKTTDYLVDEGDKSSTKRKKAEELGIKIITNLDNFLRELNND